MGILFHASMFITSFAPLWFSIILIDVFNIMDNTENLHTEWTSIFLILIFNILAVWCIIKEIHRIEDASKRNMKIKDASSEKAITSEYLLSYILPLFAFDFTLWRQVIIVFDLLFCVRIFVHTER